MMSRERHGLKTPRHRIWLILLAAALAFTSGHRALDMIGVSRIAGGGDEWDPGAAIGASIIPLFTVPLVAILCLVVLRSYPRHPIGLFYWAPGSRTSQIVWSLFFGLLSVGSLSWATAFAYGIQGMVRQRYFELLPDAGLNLIASLGAIYLWLCLRAIACYTRQ